MPSPPRILKKKRKSGLLVDGLFVDELISLSHSLSNSHSLPPVRIPSWMGVWLWLSVWLRLWLRLINPSTNNPSTSELQKTWFFRFLESRDFGEVLEILGFFRFRVAGFFSKTGFLSSSWKKRGFSYWGA